MLSRLLKPKWLLFGVLVLGAALRLWGLGGAELFQDEGAYGFRSIGYLDFLQNDDQTTPIQWFRDGRLPWWTRLSFHDHPPLFFLVNNVFATLFGDSRFVMRLPAALAGILSLYFIYLIFRRVSKNDYVGVLGAVFLAVNHIHIWISRSIGLESLLVFLIIFGIHAFLLFLEDRRYWYWVGLAMGLAMLAKYTAIILPASLVLTGLIFRRDIFKSHHFYAAVVLSLAIFSPVLIYNAYLYRTTGHFDLQFAYLFGQETPEWRASIGKAQDPFSQIVPNVLAMFSLPALFLVLAGLIFSFRFRAEERGVYPAMAWVFFITATLVLAATGSAYRFLVLYAVPFVAFMIIAVLAIDKYFWKDRRLGLACLAAFLAYELWFSVSSIFIYFPSFGVVALDDYFDSELRGFASSAFPTSPNPHINKIIQANLLKLPVGEPAIAIVYDENLSLPHKLWVFGRRTVYKGVTAMTTTLFKDLLRVKGLDYLDGYRIYFVKASPDAALNQYFLTNEAARFEQFLLNELGVQPEKVIYGHNNLPMFTIYKFQQ